MIQDIAPFCYDNHYTPQMPNEDAYVILVQNRSILWKVKEDGLQFPRYSELPALPEKTVYLFSIGNDPFFLAEFSASFESLLQTGFVFGNVRDLRHNKPNRWIFAAVTAFQLANWYHGNRFCGCCGHPMRHSFEERALICDNCQNTVYPKICPAVIVAVTHDDKILMTKYAGANHTRYALIAGFAEIGETIEDTVRREVMEEVGIRVKNLRYYKSQPWSFSDTLLMGFFCEPDGSEEITLDKQELSEAEWQHRSDMIMEDDGVSLTNEMMGLFKNGFDPCSLGKPIL